MPAPKQVSMMAIAIDPARPMVRASDRPPFRRPVIVIPALRWTVDIVDRSVFWGVVGRELPGDLSGPRVDRRPVAEVTGGHGVLSGRREMHQTLG
jgi:hypothetical protein